MTFEETLRTLKDINEKALKKVQDEIANSGSTMVLEDSEYFLQTNIDEILYVLNNIDAYYARNPKSFQAGP